MSNDYSQRTTHQHRTDLYPESFPMRPLDSNRKELRDGFAFSRKTVFPDGQLNKTVATVENLIDV